MLLTRFFLECMKDELLAKVKRVRRLCYLWDKRKWQRRIRRKEEFSQPTLDLIRSTFCRVISMRDAMLRQDAHTIRRIRLFAGWCLEKRYHLSRDVTLNSLASHVFTNAHLIPTKHLPRPFPYPYVFRFLVLIICSYIFIALKFKYNILC